MDERLILMHYVMADVAFLYRQGQVSDPQGTNHSDRTKRLATFRLAESNDVTDCDFPQ